MEKIALKMSTVADLLPGETLQIYSLTTSIQIMTSQEMVRSRPSLDSLLLYLLTVSMGSNARNDFQIFRRMNLRI